MDFSIVIPIYNIEKYLRECIDSLLNQDFDVNRYELILVDDGSVDQSGQICDAYSKDNPNIKVIHKTNGGLSDARNYGVSASIGKYLIFIDGDDYCKPNFLEQISNNINDNDFPDVILCNGFFQFQDGSNVLDIKAFKLEDIKINNLNGNRVLEYLFRDKKYSNWSWSACFNVYKTQYWKDNEFEFKVDTTCEDAELIPKVILLASKCSLLSEVYYCYRIDRSGSIMDKVTKKRIYDMLDIAKYWIDYSQTLLENPQLVTSIRGKYSDEAFRYIKYIKDFQLLEQREIIELFQKNRYTDYILKPNYKVYKILLNFISYNKLSQLMDIESKVLFYIKNKQIRGKK